MKIYTRKGDDGTTGLWYGGRVEKFAGRPEAYGSVDEADSALGLARAAVRRAERRVAALKHEGDLADDIVLTYLNRLSDAVYAMARFADEPEPELFKGRG